MSTPPKQRVAAADLAAWIRARASGRPRFLVGIAGPPGCGKSTIAASVAADLGAPTIPMDGYHLPNAVLDERGQRAVKGAPHTFDVDAFVAMLRTLRDGADLVLPDFDRSVDEPRPGRIRVAADSPIVIVEGNYLLVPDPPWDEVADLLDVVAYVEIDREVRVRRLIDRHVSFGKTLDEARSFVATSDERNTAVIESARHRADVFVDPAGGLLSDG